MLANAVKPIGIIRPLRIGKVIPARIGKGIGHIGHKGHPRWRRQIGRGFHYRRAVRRPGNS